MKKTTTFNYLLPVAVIFLLLVGEVSGQCLADRHTTNLTDGWLSCEVDQNPVAGMGDGHWIHYDLGQTVALFDIHIWNISHPGFLKNGVRDIVIHTSTDGSHYTLIDTFSVPRANPSSFFEGHHLGDLGGQSLRYVVITALNSHGGTCAGFAEVRMHTTDIVINELTLDLSPCENAGLLKTLTGGVNFQNGTYEGAGVTDHGDGTFDFDPDIPGPGKTTIDYHYTENGQPQTISTVIDILPCGDERCPDCVLCGADTTLLNSSNIPSGIYHDDALFSGGQVQDPNHVTLRGREEVTLLPGFALNTSEEFLAEIRTCEVNQLMNMGFEEGTQDWNLYVNSDSAEANWSVSNSEYFAGSHSAHLEVTQAHPDRWRVQFYQGGIDVETDKTYNVSFAARSHDAEGFFLIVEENGSPYTTYLSEIIRLKPHWQKFSFEFTVDEPTTLDLRWSAHAARYAGSYFIDEVRVSEK